MKKFILISILSCLATQTYACLEQDFKQELIQDLYTIGAVKTGDFKLKSGEKSPIYIDLRLVMSHPKVLKKIAYAISSQVHRNDYDIICGVPYGALAFALATSLETNKPLIMPRKEVKNYGTQKRIDGNYTQGNRCLVIEDVVTTGDSTVAIAEILKEEKLIVSKIVAIVDRGGTKSLRKKGYDVVSLFTLEEIIDAKPIWPSSITNTLKNLDC